MEAKFTKGEWHIVPDMKQFINCGNATVAVSYGFTEEIQLANAKLIAAAPEMYDMLLKLEEILRSLHCHGVANEITFLRNKINS